MRLLLSAYACRPNAGSEPGVGWSWATSLAARGIEVHTLVVERNRQAVEAGLKSTAIPNLHFHFVDVPAWAKKFEALQYFYWQFAALKAARLLHTRLKFDVSHHVTYASVHVPSQLWRLEIPFVFGPIGGGQTTPAAVWAKAGPAKAATAAPARRPLRRAEVFAELLEIAIVITP